MATHPVYTYSKSNCDIPKNRPDFSQGMIGATSVACSNNISKIAGEGDQIIIDNQIEDYINSKGYPVLFYPYLYHTESSEKIHGEHSAAEYGKPIRLTMVMTIQEQPSWIDAGGFNNGTEVTAWIHIKTFMEKVTNIIDNDNEYASIYEKPFREENAPLGSQLRYNDIKKAIEPKPKDLFQLTTFGCDRPWDRGNKIFEITNVEDEILSENFNIAMGHYVWKITATRYRYSWETGMSQSDEKSSENYYLGIQGEKGNHQIHENEPLLQMFLNENGNKKVQFGKVYNHDIEKESKNIFDMTQNVENFYDNKIEQEEPITTPQKIDSNGYF